MGNLHVSNVQLDAKRLEWQMPSWCVGPEACKLTDEHCRLVKESWTQVMKEDNGSFTEAKKIDPQLTPATFFYDQFYTQFFEWLPEVKPMFKRGMRQQGRMLANVIKFIVDNLTNSEEIFRENLTILAKVHNGRGITSNHYSVMGMVLLRTIRHCIGAEDFTDAHKEAWVVVYSRMMHVMIPVVMSGETITADFMDSKQPDAKKKDPKKAHRWAWRDVSEASSARCPVTDQSGGSCPASGRDTPVGSTRVVPISSTHGRKTPSLHHH